MKMRGQKLMGSYADRVWVVLGEYLSDARSLDALFQSSNSFLVDI